jgi:microcystin degradation protein MlrC
VARRSRIAFGRIAQETHALSPLRTSLDEFRAQHWLAGEGLRAACGRFGTEAPGFLRAAELSGLVRAAGRAGDVDLIPTLSAWAVPSGPLARACFDALAEDLERRLRAARPLDGVFLALHGAMGVEGLLSPEAELARRARAASGAARIAVTLDLHATIDRALIDACDVIVAYATNPHRDHARTGARAGALLIDALRGRVEPVTAWRSLPMILGGGAEIDLLAPMRAIFRRARAMERERGVLSASIAMCHPWSDAPDRGWSTLVITDGDRALAERLADELAQSCWEVRDVAPPTFASADEAIETAKRARLARRLGVVVMSDTSDVVSAGATGDSTHLVRALLERGEGMTCYAAIRDPATAIALGERAVGEAVHVRVGGALDPARSEPLDVDAMIAGKRSEPGLGRRVLLDLDPPAHISARSAGRVRLVVTEGPPLVMRPAFYTSIGLDIRRADVVVVKSFFPFRLFFLPWARKTIYVRTRGLTDLDASFVLSPGSPVHPRDRIDDWRAIDRRRRGATT